MLKSFLHTFLYLTAVVGVILAAAVSGGWVGYKLGSEEVKEASQFLIMQLEDEIESLERDLGSANSYLIQYFHNIKGGWNECG